MRLSFRICFAIRPYRLQRFLVNHIPKCVNIWSRNTLKLPLSRFAFNLYSFLRYQAVKVKCFDLLQMKIATTFTSKEFASRSASTAQGWAQWGAPLYAGPSWAMRREGRGTAMTASASRSWWISWTPPRCYRSRRISSTTSTSRSKRWGPGRHNWMLLITLTGELKGRNCILQTFQYEEKTALYSNQEHRERRGIVIGVFLTYFSLYLVLIWWKINHSFF